MKPAEERTSQHGQRGAVAIIVALSLAVLVGFAGLALDLGRLYVNKTELQSAADACALAAAAQLTCDLSAGPCPSAFLLNAENAGIFAGSQNKKDFQAGTITIAASDVRFYSALAPNSAYRSRAAGAAPDSKFAMCIARANGIVPWFMGVLGIGASNVNATAVATLAPGQAFCNAAPMGVCTQSTSGPDYGYTVGQWIASAFTSGNGANSNDNLTGNFRWVDFTPNAGGNNEIRDQLASTAQVCGIKVGDNIQQPGQQQGAKSAYNTRFGIYPNGANAYTPATAPPDFTGYAYPNKAPGNPVIGIGTSAFNNFQTKQTTHTPFTSNEYGVNGAGGNFNGNPISSAQHQAYGQNRRVVAVPFIDCNAGNTVPIKGMACVLMLNPMSNGANGTIYLEYRGSATAASSPCASFGLPGGSSGNGPFVPTLVQ